MEEDFIKTTDYLPDELVTVRIETPILARIGKDGFWHASDTDHIIPSHLVTGWAYITK